jgi:poly(beta-D-mannuronate) lyase
VSLSRRRLSLGLAVFGAVLAMVSAPRAASAATFTVTSISPLQTRINAANPGDIIILQNGTYTTSAAITITRVGTASQPITIQAQTPGGAEIRGTNGFAVASPAAFIVIDGFLLTHASGTDTIASGQRISASPETRSNAPAMARI